MSFGARLAAAFVGLVVAVSLLFIAVGFFAAGSGATGQIDRFLENRAEELVDDVRARPGRDGDSNRRGNSGQGRREQGTVDDDSVVQTLDADGTAVATTSLVLPVTDADRTLAASGKDDMRFRTIETEQGAYRMVTAAIPSGGAVQVAAELSQTNSTIDVIRGQLALAVPIVALLAGLVGLLLARRITGPLRSLSATVDQVAATGDLTVPVDVSGRDEIGRLASGFDNLLSGLRRSRQQQHQLVQDAAHELRTPLTSVKANVDLLAAAPGIDAETRADTLRSVQGELRELTRLIDEIVEVATDRYQAQDFVEVELAAVVEVAIQRFRARATGRELLLDLNAVTVRGDHDALVRAADNLLSNADKYSPAGTPISVAVAADHAGAATVAVSDHGPGIPVDQRERVFDRFHRLDEARSQPGSGLGLAIVASIIDAHGGKVGVADNPGGGAVVSFSLPTR